MSYEGGAASPRGWGKLTQRREGAKGAEDMGLGWQWGGPRVSAGVGAGLGLMQARRPAYPGVAAAIYPDCSVLRDGRRWERRIVSGPEGLWRIVLNRACGARRLECGRFIVALDGWSIRWEFEAGGEQSW